MLITPKFSVSQTEEQIILVIRVPYIKVSSAEILNEGNDFSFYCKPYLLKLTWPRDIDDDEEKCNAKYDPNVENGTLTVSLFKRNKGEHFPDLDLLTTLYQVRRVEKLASSLNDENSIDVLHSENFISEEDNDESENNTAQAGELVVKSRYPYGFNLQYEHVLDNLHDNLLDMLEVNQPELLHPLTRREQRIQYENKLFDPHRYLGDFFEIDEDLVYTEAMSYTPFWNEQWNSFKKREKENNSITEKDITLKKNKYEIRELCFEDIGGFSETEKDILANTLKNKEFLIREGSEEEQSVLLGLIDILFAFCYEYRTVQGDFNVESPTSVTKLSSALSWLERYNPSYDSISTVIKFSMRRMVVYPYIRYWKYGRKILADVAKVLILGKRTILKCLLQLYHLFEHTDTHYLLNKLYLEDYLIWLQTVTDETILKLGNQFNKEKDLFEKASHEGRDFIGFYLAELEEWSLNQLEEDEDEDEDEKEEDESEYESTDDDEDDESVQKEPGKQDDNGKEISLEKKQERDVNPVNNTEVKLELASEEEEVVLKDAVLKNESEKNGTTIPAALLDYTKQINENPLLAYLRREPSSSLSSKGDDSDTTAAKIAAKLLAPIDTTDKMSSSTSDEPLLKEITTIRKAVSTLAEAKTAAEEETEVEDRKKAAQMLQQLVEGSASPIKPHVNTTSLSINKKPLIVELSSMSLDANIEK